MEGRKFHRLGSWSNWSTEEWTSGLPSKGTGLEATHCTRTSARLPRSSVRNSIMTWLLSLRHSKTFIFDFSRNQRTLGILELNISHLKTLIELITGHYKQNWPCSRYECQLCNLIDRVSFCY